jgi:hypothetical protein
MKQKITRSGILPVLILLILVAAAVMHTDLIRKTPIISSLSPAAAFPEDELTIRGENFGSDRGAGDVVIAGIRVTSSHYLSWTDSEIRLLVPHAVQSGRVFVETDRGTSNGALFTNKTHIPVILSGPVKPGLPYIERIGPEKGPVGSLIRIEGSNFGTRRAEARVFFRFLLADFGGKGIDENLESVACSAMDEDYLNWSDREIRVYVPDGAVSGSIYIETDRGRSNSVYFELTTPIGSKRFERKKGYQIQHEVRISHIAAPKGSAGAEMWVPRLSAGYAQQSIEESHEPEPIWIDFNGVMRYHVPAEDQWMETVLSHTYWFDRYSIATDIVLNASSKEYNVDRGLYRRYTAAGPFIPSDDEYFRDLVGDIVTRGAHPYEKAEEIYRFLLDRLEVKSARGSVSEQALREAVENGSCPTSVYGLLFVTLARAAGIPARPNAGFIVYGDKLTLRHIWAEFYLPQFGWVPTDPALGDGISYVSLPVKERESFYFGNLDNQHICFSRRVEEIPKVNPHSETKLVSPPFSLQTVWEEYQKDDKWYRSGWNDIRVIDWW